MQFFKPLRQEVSRFTKTFFQENPNLMKKYVNTGLTVLSLFLAPVDAFLKHLLVVQDLDPNEIPGRRDAEQLQAAMCSLFQNLHDKEYESDFDLSWAMKRFVETRKLLQDRKITEKQFKEFTDISRLDCGESEGSFVRTVSTDNPGIEVDGPFVVEADADVLTHSLINQEAPVSVKRELPLIVYEDENVDNPRTDRDRQKDVLKKYADLLRKEAPDNGRPADLFAPVPMNGEVKIEEVGTDAIAGLRSALETISKSLELNTTTKGVKTAKNKKLNRTARFPNKKQMQEKIRKATALANEMVARGLCNSDQKAIDIQVSEILKWGDESFESLEKVVKRHDILLKDVPVMITNEWPAKTTRSLPKRKAKK